MWDSQTDVIDDTIERLRHLRHVLYIDPAALDGDIIIKRRWHPWAAYEVRGYSAPCCSIRPI